MKTIKIKYMHDDLIRAEKIETGDWIDLRCASKNGILLKKGEFKLIPLGVAMELPYGYEANLVPRSSTFKNWGIIQTNGIGVIDESYCGDEDWWMMPIYATRDTLIRYNDRICQFRINKKMEEIDFITVEKLHNEERGGFGTTGLQ